MWKAVWLSVWQRAYNFARSIFPNPIALAKCLEIRPNYGCLWRTIVIYGGGVHSSLPSWPEQHHQQQLNMCVKWLLNTSFIIIASFISITTGQPKIYSILSSPWHTFEMTWGAFYWNNKGLPIYQHRSACKGIIGLWSRGAVEFLLARTKRGRCYKVCCCSKMQVRPMSNDWKHLFSLSDLPLGLSYSRVHRLWHQKTLFLHTICCRKASSRSEHTEVIKPPSLLLWFYVHIQCHRIYSAEQRNQLVLDV